MAVSVLQPLLEEFYKNCSDDEIVTINQDVKQRHPYLDHDDSSDRSLLNTFKELYQSGKITGDNIDLLNILAERSHKKDQIKSSMQRMFKSSSTSKKEHLLGRRDEIEELDIQLSENGLINLYGDSGVGKTAVAKEMTENLKNTNWNEYVIDLREATGVVQMYIEILKQMGYVALFSNDDEMETLRNRIIDLFKKKCAGQSKVVLLLDNLEDQLTAECQNELNTFYESVHALEAFNDKRLRIITTSSHDIPIESIKGLRVEGLSDNTSKEFINRSSKLDSYEEQPWSDTEGAALDKIAKYCKNIPYFLEGAEQIMRDHFISPVELLQKIEEQEKLGVNEAYLITSLVFNSIHKDNLKKLAVKVCIFPRHFTASEAMKIAELKTHYDAELDLEFLVKQKVLKKEVVDGIVKYNVHSLFKTFAASHLRIKYPFLEEGYNQAELMFGHHFLHKLRTQADSMVKDFIGAFQELRSNELNFDVVLQSPVFREQFLPLSSDETLCRVIMTIEPLKSISNRRELYKTWADALEQKGNLLTSAYMRCWQSIQLADMEGTVTSEEILQHAEDCFKKTTFESSPMSVQYASVKALLLYCKGKIKCMKSAHLDLEKKKRVKEDLLKKAREELLDALMIYQDVYSEHSGDHSLAVRTLNVLGNCNMELEDAETAEGYYQKALEMKLRLTDGNEKHSEIPTFYNQLSQVYETLADKKTQGFSIRGLLGLGNTEAKRYYEKAVLYLRTAVELNRELGLEDTLGTATFNRNMANILIPLKRYDEALECAKASYEIRSKLLGIHPETVRILYLMGVINEWRKDPPAALHSYEKAFEIEEKLPEENHSMVKDLICSRFEAMCVRCKEKRKLLEYKERMEQLKKVKIRLEPKKEHPTDVSMKEVPFADKSNSFNEEVTINVMEQGGTYDYSPDGFVLFFPENCISGSGRIKCEINPSLPSPSNVKEHLVSSVIRLGSGDLNLRKSFVMTMLHCGPGEEDGFETKVKVFNERKELWEDYQGLESVTPSAVEFSTQYIAISLTKFTAVAVVTRLITNPLDIPVSGCEIKLSVCPSITIRFPEGAVDTLTRGELQVLPMPDHLIKNPESVPCPILLFSGFKDVIFKKPVTISAIIPARSHPKVRLLRLDDTRNSPFLWDDITHVVSKIKKPTVKDNTVELQVQRFCGLWIWFSAKNLVYSSYMQFTYLISSPPCVVSFAAYRKKSSRQPQDSTHQELKLTCVANSSQAELTDRLEEKQNYECLEELTADWKMRKNDKAYPIIPDIERTEDCFLEFCGSEGGACQKPFEVDTSCIYDTSSVELYIHPNKDGKSDKGCKMILDLNDTSCSEDDRDVQSKNVWVEYCGIDFDALEDLPVEFGYAVYGQLFSGDPTQEKISGCTTRWYAGGLKQVLSLLSRKKFDQVYNVMSGVDCFRADFPNKYFAERLELLQKGKDLVSQPLLDLPDEIKESIKTITNIITIKNRMKFGRELGMRKEDLDKCDSSSEVLKSWICNYQKDGKVADLFKAFRKCDEKDLATGLAKVITELAQKQL